MFMKFTHIILALLLFSGMFVLGCTNPNNNGNTQLNNQSNSEAANLFFSFFSYNIPTTYSYKYTEIINNANKTVQIVKSDNLTKIFIKTLPWDRGYLIYKNGNNNSIIGCTRINNPAYIPASLSSCVNLTNKIDANEYIKSDYTTLSNYPFSASILKSNELFYRRLYELGVLTFSPVGACTWHNKTYYKLKFDIKYKDLTLKQLKEMNINTDSLPDEVSATYCVDKDGFRYKKEIDQMWAGQTKLKWTMVVDNYSTNLINKDDLVYPYNLSNDFTKFKILFNDGRTMFRKYAFAAMTGNSTVLDTTAKNLAYNYRNPIFCTVLSSKPLEDACFISSAADIGSELICNYAPNYLNDDCYLEIVHKQRNTSLCSHVANQTKYNECIHMFDNINMTKTSNNQTNNAANSTLTNNSKVSNGAPNSTSTNQQDTHSSDTPPPLIVNMTPTH